MIKLKCWRRIMTFIIHFKNKPRKTYNSKYNENIEHERDAA